MRLCRFAKPLLVLLVFTLFLCLLDRPATSAHVALRLQEPEKQRAVPKQPSAESEYVGSEVCKTCHEDLPRQGFYKTFEKSRHHVTTLDTKKGPEWHGCEACHGPGKTHVEGGGDKTKIFSFKSATAREVSQRCLKCHQSGDEHANFNRSAHLKNNVSCLSCHSSHQGMTDQFLLIKTQPELCYTCHLKMKAQFNMPFHHRVEEGLVKCSDCHNPHGGFVGTQLRSAAARDAVCFNCHVDKQGPFVFEHQATKTEGCETCHSPHGSPNPNLLKTSNLNILCLKCHTGSSFSSASGTPDFHNQAAQFQACTLCHTMIHGSNFDRHLLK